MHSCLRRACGKKTDGVPCPRKPWDSSGGKLVLIQRRGATEKKKKKKAKLASSNKRGKKIKSTLSKTSSDGIFNEMGEGEGRHRPKTFHAIIAGGKKGGKERRSKLSNFLLLMSYQKKTALGRL